MISTRLRGFALLFITLYINKKKKKINHNLPKDVCHSFARGFPSPGYDTMETLLNVTLSYGSLTFLNNNQVVT